MKLVSMRVMSMQAQNDLIKNVFKVDEKLCNKRKMRVAYIYNQAFLVKHTYAVCLEV